MLELFAGQPGSKCVTKNQSVINAGIMCVIFTVGEAALLRGLSVISLLNGESG